MLRDYVLERTLASDATGSVYLARHVERAAERFRVWVLRPRAAGRARREAFERRAALLTALEHRGVVPLAAAWLAEDNAPVIVAPEPPGTILAARLARDGPFAPLDLAQVLLDLGAALNYLHGQRPTLCHGRLDPTSVLLAASDGRARLLDAGHARWLCELGIDPEAVRAPPPYRAPEVIDLARPLDPPAEQFALASIAYECLTGAPAFAGEDQDEVRRAMCVGPRPRVAAVRDDVPPEVDAALHRAWSLDPGARHPSASAFAVELAAALVSSTRVDAPRAAHGLLRRTLVDAAEPPRRLADVAPQDGARRETLRPFPPEHGAGAPPLDADARQATPEAGGDIAEVAPALDAGGPALDVIEMPIAPSASPSLPPANAPEPPAPEPAPAPASDAASAPDASEVEWLARAQRRGRARMGIGLAIALAGAAVAASLAIGAARRAPSTTAGTSPPASRLDGATAAAAHAVAPQRAVVDAGEATAPRAADSARPAPPPSRPLPQVPDRESVRQARREIEARVHSCERSAGREVSARLERLGFEGAGGRVTDVEFAVTRGSTSPSARCVMSAAAAAHVPPFRAASWSTRF